MKTDPSQPASNENRGKNKGKVHTRYASCQKQKGVIRSKEKESGVTKQKRNQVSSKISLQDLAGGRGLKERVPSREATGGNTSTRKGKLILQIVKPEITHESQRNTQKCNVARPAKERWDDFKKKGATDAINMKGICQPERHSSGLGRSIAHRSKNNRRNDSRRAEDEGVAVDHLENSREETGKSEKREESLTLRDELEEGEKRRRRTRGGR